MRAERRNAIFLILFFFAGALILGICISVRMAEIGLWCLPALCHLYPFITLLFIVIYSVITSRRIFWRRMFILLVLGLALECFMFWVNKLFIFVSPRIMASVIFLQVIAVYGLTWGIYFSLTSQPIVWRK